jgi:hypothetical protein
VLTEELDNTTRMTTAQGQCLKPSVSSTPGQPFPGGSQARARSATWEWSGQNTSNLPMWGRSAPRGRGSSGARRRHTSPGAWAWTFDASSTLPACVLRTIAADVCRRDRGPVKALQFARAAACQQAGVSGPVHVNSPPYTSSEFSLDAFGRATTWLHLGRMSLQPAADCLSASAHCTCAPHMRRRRELTRREQLRIVAHESVRNCQQRLSSCITCTYARPLATDRRDEIARRWHYQDSALTMVTCKVTWPDSPHSEMTA